MPVSDVRSKAPEASRALDVVFVEQLVLAVTHAGQHRQVLFVPLFLGKPSPYEFLARLWDFGKNRQLDFFKWRPFVLDCRTNFLVDSQTSWQEVATAVTAAD